MNIEWNAFQVGFCGMVGVDAIAYFTPNFKEGTIGERFKIGACMTAGIATIFSCLITRSAQGHPASEAKSFFEGTFCGTITVFATFMVCSRTMDWWANRYPTVCPDVVDPVVTIKSKPIELTERKTVSQKINSIAALVFDSFVTFSVIAMLTIVGERLILCLGTFALGCFIFRCANERFFQGETVEA